MKRILITGANSYIGTSLERYLSQWPEEYAVETVDMVDGTWREKSFAGFDTVFHVAGIAHSDTRKATEEQQRLYYAINTDLTIETAKKGEGGRRGAVHIHEQHHRIWRQCGDWRAQGYYQRYAAHSCELLWGQ